MRASVGYGVEIAINVGNSQSGPLGGRGRSDGTATVVRAGADQATALGSKEAGCLANINR